MKTLENKPRNLANVRAAIYGQPWAITEIGFENMCAIAETHIAGNPVEFKSAVSASPQESDDEDLGFDLESNVAIIPVAGPIFPKANLMTQYSGAVSLADVQQSISDALSVSPNALIFNFDSPGGSVVGLWDFCDWLSQLCDSTTLPIIALVNPMAASAAWAIASQCDMVYSMPSGVSGSIGIIGKIDNRDRAEKNSGNDSIVYRTSELKGIGAGAVTPNQQGEIQRGMMAHMAKFQAAVKRGRPGVDVDAVSTGQTWMGESANGDPSAQDMGLIDGISTLEKLIAKYGSK